MRFVIHIVCLSIRNHVLLMVLEQPLDCAQWIGLFIYLCGGGNVGAEETVLVTDIPL